MKGALRPIARFPSPSRTFYSGRSFLTRVHVFIRKGEVCLQSLLCTVNDSRFGKLLFLKTETVSGEPAYRHHLFSQRCPSLHFLTFSCYHRQPKFGTPTSRATVESALEQVLAEARSTHLWIRNCPEHVHTEARATYRVLSPGGVKATEQYRRYMRCQEDALCLDECPCFLLFASARPVCTRRI
jgi:hypothetical protein